MAKTSKGHIQQLPTGSFRVKVYAGTGPVTGKERLLRQDRHATVGQALDKYLEVADLKVSTRDAH